MQPSYALLPATSYPKTVGGICYAIIVLIPIGLKQPLVTSQSQAGEGKYGIPSCSHPSISQESQTTFGTIITF